MSEQQLQAPLRGTKRYFLRFPDLYGLDAYFVCDSFLFGQVLNIYAELGFPDCNIPDNKPYSKAKLEEKIIAHSCIQAPAGFSLYTAPAGIITVLANFILEKSGFVENSESQKKYIENAVKYATSQFGLAEQLIMHTFSGYKRNDILALNYEELIKLTVEAANLQAKLYGVDCSTLLLNNDSVNQDNDFQPVQRETQILPQPDKALVAKALKMNPAFIESEKPAFIKGNGNDYSLVRDIIKQQAQNN